MALLPRRADTFTSKEELNDTFYLSKIEAIKVQKDLVKNWEPTREVWALKYGSTFMGVASAVSSVMINSLFRRKLKLRIGGQFLTTIAMMAGPGITANFAHDVIITNNILLYSNQCPICYELKAGLLLNTCALLYPLALSPALNIGIAGNLGLRTPHIYEIKEIVKFWWSVVKPAINHLSIAFCFNSVLAGAIVYKQFTQIGNVANTMLKVKEYVKSIET